MLHFLASENLEAPLETYSWLTQEGLTWLLCFSKRHWNPKREVTHLSDSNATQRWEMEGESILATQQIWAVMQFPTANHCIFFSFQYSSWFGVSQMLCPFDAIFNISRLCILHGSFLLFGVFEHWVFFFCCFHLNWAHFGSQRDFTS